MCGLDELALKFSKINSECKQYLSKKIPEVLSLTKSTIITKGAFYNLRPFEIERAGLKKGRKLKKLPASIKNTHVYYLDDAGRILLIDIYGQANNIINKEFFLYGKGFLERLHFTSAGGLRNILVSFFDDEILMKDINWGMYGCSESDYIYSGSILEKITVNQKEHVDSAFSTFDVIFKYKNGELEFITNVFPNGYQEQRFP